MEESPLTHRSTAFRLILAAIILGIAAGLWSLTFRREIRLETADSIASGSVGWRAAVPGKIRFPLQILTDSNEFPSRSRLILAEDGKPLGPAHQLHSDIMEKGEGRFSHWGGWLYFSASDNSDPRTNGRAYSVTLPVSLHKSLIVLGAGIALALVVGAEALVGLAALRREGAARGRPVPYLMLRRLLSLFDRPYLSERTFWLIFGLLLAGGIALRGYWAWALGLPYVVPDSMSYVTPALDNPLLPFNEARTAGLPYLVVLGMGGFGHPMGVIALQSLLWLASTVAIVVALRKVMGFRVLALILLAYLCFIQKNLALEFTILSEHNARAIYLLTIALMLLTLRRPTWWAGLGVGLLTVFNILVKPSAMAFLPVIPIWYTLVWLFNRDRLGAVLRGCAVCIAVVAGLLGGYMTAFEDRYGTFGLSHFDGFNLYAQVGHLTVLDRGPYPEIKAEMAMFMPLYVEKYANNRRYAWNWLIYSSSNEEMKADFGERSPVRSVIRYLGTQAMGPTNAVLRDLAVEGIKAHPLQYLDLSVYTLGTLMVGGYNFTYGDFFTETSLGFHRSQARELNRWFFEREGWQDPPLRQRIRAGLERHPGGIPEGPLPAGFKTASAIVFWATHYLGKLAWGAFYAAALILLAIVPITAVAAMKGKLEFRGGTARIKGSLLAVPATPLAATVLIGLTVLGYCTALSLYCVSDPTRFLANVQDLYIVTFLGIITLTARPLRRTLAAWARSVRTGNK